MKKGIAILLAAVVLFSCCPTVYALGACSRSYPAPDTEALRFVEQLRIGWNLGNTFDAHDEAVSGELDYETVWCLAETTRELITEVKNAGFRAIRIPVSWHNHLADGESFTISRPWLDRVAEVVDYCIGQGLYVILNIHHDDGTDYVFPSKSHAARSQKYIREIWTQLARRFRDYDEHLLFECLNEPRLTGTMYEWMLLPVSPACIDAVKQINTLNQIFVDTVRSTGGQNATRYLLCPGYDCSVDGATNLFFSLPRDPVTTNDHRIIVAVHAYIPNGFTNNQVGTARWSSKNLLDRLAVTTALDKLYLKYVAKGVPVLIDEFGALDKNGNTASRVDYAGFFVENARKRGMTCFWWDNNIVSGSGMRFGLIDRASLTWKYPQIVKAMMDAA